jgi:hypothetical protein
MTRDQVGFPFFYWIVANDVGFRRGDQTQKKEIGPDRLFNLI